jgi:hypothetical protein
MNLLPTGVEAIAITTGSTSENIALRIKNHTPLRYGVAPVGLGVGNQGLLEQVKFYGAGIKEPKKFIVARTAASLVKFDLAGSGSNFKVFLTNPIALVDFKAGVIQMLSTQQQM